MPRAGWLAVGGIVAGICVPFLPERPVLLVSLAACVVLIAAASLLIGRQQPLRQRPLWIALAAGAIGASIVVARLALGASLGPAGPPTSPPFDERAWQADEDARCQARLRRRQRACQMIPAVPAQILQHSQGSSRRQALN